MWILNGILNGDFEWGFLERVFCGAFVRDFEWGL